MAFPQGNEDGVSDIDLMRHFLRALYDLLRDALSEGRDGQGNPLFHEELLPLLAEGFGDMEPHFGRLDRAITEIPPRAIQDHGLEGRPLRMKLRIVHFFAERFERSGGRGPFRKVLDTLEGLLDSIIDAAGTGGAIKEFKEFLRNATAD